MEGKVELTEIGPRFEMKGMAKQRTTKCGIHLVVESNLLVSSFPSVYEIRLGTVDQTEADVEWRLKPYMNTSKKRKFLT